jgi:hypothetical protein
MFWLFQRQLEELRCLREEASRPTELLPEVVSTPERLERTQYS